MAQRPALNKPTIEAKYQLVLDISPTPLMLVARDGTILLANEHFETLFGYEKGQLLGKKLDVLLPDEIRHAHGELRQAFFELPTARSMGKGRDLFGKHKLGHRIPVEIGLQPIGDEGVVGALVSVVDITERKHNESRIRLALDASASAMIMINDHGRIVLTNASANAMFGYDKDALLDRPVEDLVPERFRRKHSVYRTSYLNTRERRAMGIGRDLYGLKSDSSEFPIEIGLTPIDGVDGRRIVATIIDITERKAREDLIQQKNIALTHLNEELTQFAYSASHDLKAPLASITGAMKICQQDIAAGNIAEISQNLARAQSMAERLGQRIEDMLALARADHVENELTPVSIADAVAEIWANIRGLAGGDEVRLVTRYHHPDPIVTVKVRLLVILENLLSNALKYRDPAKKNSEIVIETGVSDDAVVIAVRDNGVGIPADCHDKVFKLFQRFTNAANPGSGLGLALVQKNVRYLGGTIIFESSPEGTAFTTTLPLHPRPSVKDAAA
jgi:PAS domain S-box-containing protein